MNNDKTVSAHNMLTLDDVMTIKCHLKNLHGRLQLQIAGIHDKEAKADFKEYMDNVVFSIIKLDGVDELMSKTIIKEPQFTSLMEAYVEHGHPPI
jgi:hypothetical protein